jgi:4-diphosphocytidyl-2-C-methyl-D-erythritol kinase
MVVFANAKINLGLYVTEKRPDGFHNIESLFLPISLADVLEARPRSDQHFDITIDGIPVDGNTSKNLCTKAYELLQQDFGLSGVDVFLLKNIPLGAGLGGGSSDGAFMLKLLNELFKLNLSTSELRNYASQLGSDCPFFIENVSAFVSGRGEQMEPVDLNLSGKKLVIVHPGIHVSTAEAYALIQPKPSPIQLNNLTSLPLSSWRHEVSNDFEVHIARLFPVIQQIKNDLYDAGAVYASMSGSGSAVYGIFEELAVIPTNCLGFFTAKAEIL